MMNLEQELLIRRFPDFQKLAAFGFVKNDNAWQYETLIGEGAFRVLITVSENGVTDGKVLDVFTDEEYVQVRTAGRRGTYAAKIRQDYLQILETIARECFFEIPYLLPQSWRIACAVRQNFGQQETFPFARKPECRAFGQERDSWYALIQPADASALLMREGKTEVLEVRCSAENREELLQRKGFVRPLQMKKGNWIGIILEEMIDDAEIMSLIGQSRRIAEGRNHIAEGRKEWVYPANPRYFDLDHGFSVSDQLYWKQSSKVRVGDLVYLYYGMPFGEIRYLCEVTEADIVNQGRDDGPIRMETLMRIRRLKFFGSHLLNRSLLKKYGFTNFRGPRYMTRELKDKIEELYGKIEV